MYKVTQNDTLVVRLHLCLLYVFTGQIFSQPSIRQSTAPPVHPVMRPLRSQPAPSFVSKMAGGEVGVTLGQPHLSRQDLTTLVRLAS